MKKLFKRLCVTVLSFLMVVSSTTLPAFGEDINYNEKNDIANSFRYSNGQVKERGSANYVARASVNSGWPDDPKAICKGIDVSYHNGTIDWKKVKQSEVEYAIIRCGYGIDDKKQDDKKWEENVKGCVDNNIPYGVYLYSYADTVEKASSEADHAIRLLQGKKFKYPVYYDLEEDKLRDELKLSKKTIADIAQTFCDKLTAKGYTVGIYANKDWFTNYLTDSRFNNWTKWVAQYNTACNYQGKYDMWQCSCTGKISGISTNVDLNYSYSPFENSYGGGNTNNGGTTTKYSDGLNEIQGELYYFKNNRIDTSYSGLATYKGDTYLVTKGMVNKTQSGLVQSGSNWYMLTNGKLNKDFTDLYYYNNNWYYIVNGVLDWTFNGVVSYNNNLYYVEGSTISWTYNNVAEYKGTKYYFYKSKVDYGFNDLFYTGDTWYYIKDGKVDTSYNDLYYYNNGWYYIENGTITWKYTNLVKYNGAMYYVDHSILNWNYNGIAEKDGTLYYVSNSVVDYRYKGLYEYNKKYYYIENGQVNKNYNGTCKYNSKDYYVTNGVVDPQYTGVVESGKDLLYVKKRCCR